MDTEKIKQKAKKEIEKVKNLKELDAFFKKYFGKKGEMSGLFSSLKDIKSDKKKAETGEKLNQLKLFLTKKVEKKKDKLEESFSQKELKNIDITEPGYKVDTGNLHPLTLVIRKTEEIFQKLGFSVVEGPQIEDERHNFDALNIPPDHPARDLWDTFWLKGKSKQSKENLLLRTHTSPVQIRYMEKNNPPLRIIAPGRIFRYEATDASHEFNFYQVEGLMVAKEVSIANFKAIIHQFLNSFFKKKVGMRMRPSFFPFTEPSFEIDITCVNCEGKGCSVCSKTGWVEMLGAGMVHPNVLKACGLNPNNWQGFAFGVGLDRLAMMKYKIDDIRLFYSSDLRFLKQF